MSIIIIMVAAGIVIVIVICGDAYAVVNTCANIVGCKPGTNHGLITIGSRASLCLNTILYPTGISITATTVGVGIKIVIVVHVMIGLQGMC